MTAIVETLLGLSGGAKWATAVRANGRPGRIRLPDDRDERAALFAANDAGGRFDAEFHARGGDPWRELGSRLGLYCPGRADGRTLWAGVDLDGLDHGGNGLVSPSAAMRAIAERLDFHGLLDGALFARSPGGQGRHVWLCFAQPIPLPHAVLCIGAVLAYAFEVADRDAEDSGRPHAFTTCSGGVASPGQPGAVELLPRSAAQPQFGWCLTAPTSDRLLDPFEDTHVELDRVPTCDGGHLERFIDEAKAQYRPAPKRKFQPVRPRGDGEDPLAKIDDRARAFIEGGAPKGQRNAAAFASACSLLGCGVPVDETEQLILSGAVQCGLSEREAKSALASARRAVRR